MSSADSPIEEKKATTSSMTALGLGVPAISPWLRPLWLSITP